MIERKTQDRPPSNEAPISAPDFRLLFESAPGLLLVLRPDLRIVAVSDSYLRATMTRRAEILGRHIFEVFPDNPNDPQADGVRNLTRSLQRVVEERVSDIMAVQKYDIRCPDSEGGGFQERYWTPTNSPVLGAMQELLYIIHQVEDVTEVVRLRQREAEQRDVAARLQIQAKDMKSEMELRAREIADRKLAEERLRESEERFRAFMEHIPAIAWIVDAQGMFVYANPLLCATIKLSKQEIVGKTMLELFTPTLAQSYLEGNEKVLHSGLADQSLHSAYRADGTLGEFLVVRFPLPSPRGMIVGGVSLDVTEQRQAEEKVRLRDRAMGAVSQGILITDPNQPENPIIYASQGFERMTGYRSDEVLGRNCRFLQGSETDPDALARLREAIHEGRDCSVEILNYRKDGTSFWNALFVSPVRNERGDLLNFVGVQADVTERRTLEQALHQSQKMEAVGQLAGGVAHDFNNLLTIISGYSELLLTTMAAENEDRDSVEQIRDAGKRAAALTRQLLAFSRQSVLEPKVLELNGLVRETEKMLRRLVGEDVLLRTTLDPHVLQVKADPSQLGQVMMNLAVNARDAMPKGGRLSIETHNVELTSDFVRTHPEARPGRFVMLAISDTGCGMTEEVRARIFEPFFTTKGIGHGTGLGLAVVDGIVKQSGGFVTVASEPGLGTSFHIYLPAIEGSDAEMPSQEAGGQVGGAETILLVEDEEAVRDLALHVLRSRGYAVLVASNGKKALQVFESHRGPIDLLLTDVVMPEMGGADLAKHLCLRRPEIKVLYCSGYTDDAVLRQGLLHEKVNFLQKPYLPATLIHRVRQVLDEVLT